MRRLGLFPILLLGAFALGIVPAAAQRSGDTLALAAFARGIGLQDVRSFVETVQSVRASGKLPERYVTKDAAKARGWSGGGLCTVWPGRAIGGDAFRNFGNALPNAAGRTYREADLDGTCASRGAKRLVFSSDGLVFVTIDHYAKFTPVP